MEPEAPAEKAIRLLGAKAIGTRCNLCTDAVWKWVTRGNGLIPARYQQRVHALARERGIDLSAEDIIGVAA